MTRTGYQWRVVVAVFAALAFVIACPIAAGAAEAGSFLSYLGWIGVCITLVAALGAGAAGAWLAAGKAYDDTGGFSK